MSKIFKIEFQFRPVGQGLFYTGVFDHLPSKERFTMAYDCGSYSNARYIKNEIDVFKRKIKNGSKLDMLIISHFHQDHINHIVTLLKAVNGAKKVIIPFVATDEQVLLYCQYLYNGGSSNNSGLFSNPSEFLSNEEFQIDEVIEIHPSKDDDNEQSEVGNPNSPFKSEDFSFSLKNKLMVNDILQETINKTTVKHRNDIGSLVCADLWEFKFFNRKIKTRYIDRFIKKLEKVLNVTNPTINDVTEFFEQDVEVAKNKIDEYFKKSFSKGSINSTSLVVYHGAVLNLHIEHLKSYILGRPYFPPSCNTRGLSSNRCSNLLTGDILMNNIALNEIALKWSASIRDRVVYAQIPHHGASNYLIGKYFIDFKNARHHIINYGLGYKWYHPRQDILDLIQSASNRNLIHSNTQLDHVKIRYVLSN